MNAGWAGGIAGGVIGIMGGVIGTYFSIKNSKTPHERALMIRLALLCWVWITAVLVWLFAIPRPWNQAAFLLNLPLLLSIPWMNRMLARARARDESESR
jgi:Ca2+/Na+ antiporter